MTVGKRITAGFAVSIVITAVLGAFAFERLVRIDRGTVTLAENALPRTYVVGVINASAGENYARTLRHVLAEDKAMMDQIEADMANLSGEIDARMAEYETMVADAEDRALFTAAQEARATFRGVVGRVVPLSQQSKTKEATELVNRELRPAYRKYADACAALLEYNRKAGERAGDESHATVATAKTGILIGIGAALVAGVGIAFLIIRGVNRALNRIAGTLGEGGAQVAGASTQVSASSQSLAQGASEQAAALEESTSALEEMASMTRKNADTAQQARGLAGEAQAAADKGNQAMVRMSAAIGNIQKSAGETAKIIEESVQASRNGVTMADEVAKTLGEINAAASKVNDLIGEIAAASNEQSQGIGQVNTAVAQMDKVTQASAANAEESAAAAEELSSQAEQLNGVVRELVQLVGGSTAGGTVTTAPARAARDRVPHAAPAAPAKPLKLAKARPSRAQLMPLDDEERGTGRAAAAADFSEFSRAA